jgi:hypothetical protein
LIKKIQFGRIVMKYYLCPKWTAVCFTFFLLAMPLAVVADHKVDHDGDGHASYGDGGDDCDDYNADRYPGNVEICDARDLDEDCDYSTGGSRDADGDGFVSSDCRNVDSSGNVYAQGRDCDDFRANVHPLAPDHCNGRDDNCDGGIDDDAPTQFVDWDLDGHGDASESHPRICAGTAGYSPLANDCDDTNPAIEPGALVCVTEGEASVLYCNSSGQYVPSSCPEGSACVSQINGEGACVPVAAKGGKNK